MRNLKPVYILIVYVSIISLGSLISVAVLGKSPTDKKQTNNKTKTETKQSNALSIDKSENDLLFGDTMVNMTWKEIQKEAEKGSVVLFPIGVIEEHGPHIDTGSDIYLSYAICKLLKQELEKKGVASVIAPPYYWGINKDTGGFTGSFTVKPETFKSMLVETIECMKNWGFKKFFCTNVHGDPLHNDILKQAMETAREKFKVKAYKLVDVYNPGKMDIDVKKTIELPQVRKGKYFPEYHAGANETAQMRAFYPERVDEKIAKVLKPQNDFEKLGYIGDPASFDLENGKQMISNIVKYDLMQIETVMKKESK